MQSYVSTNILYNLLFLEKLKSITTCDSLSIKNKLKIERLVSDKSAIITISE